MRSMCFLNTELIFEVFIQKSFEMIRQFILYYHHVYFVIKILAYVSADNMGNKESNESAAVKRQAEGFSNPMYQMLDLGVT